MTTFWVTMLLLTLKGQDFVQKFLFEKLLQYGLDPDPDFHLEPKPETETKIFQSRIQNRNKLFGSTPELGTRDKKSFYQLNMSRSTSLKYVRKMFHVQKKEIIKRRRSVLLALFGLNFFTVNRGSSHRRITTLRVPGTDISDKVGDLSL